MHFLTKFYALPTRLVDIRQDDNYTPPPLAGLCFGFDFNIDKTQTWHC